MVLRLFYGYFSCIILGWKTLIQQCMENRNKVGAKISCGILIAQPDLSASPESGRELLGLPARLSFHSAIAHGQGPCLLGLCVFRYKEYLESGDLWKWVIGQHELTNDWIAGSTVVCAECIVFWKKTELVKSSSLNSQKLRASNNIARVESLKTYKTWGLIDLNWFMNTKNEGKVILKWSLRDCFL